MQRVIPAVRRGQLRSRFCDAGGEATVKVCGVAVGDAAGVELDTKLIDRFRVNTGTVPGCSGTSVIRTGVPDRNVVFRRRRDGAEAP
jgi:hypothetical protein